VPKSRFGGIALISVPNVSKNLKSVAFVAPESLPGEIPWEHVSFKSTPAAKRFSHDRDGSSTPFRFMDVNVSFFRPHASIVAHSFDDEAIEMSVNLVDSLVNLVDSLQNCAKRENNSIQRSGEIEKLYLEILANCQWQLGTETEITSGPNENVEIDSRLLK
jgi:hypothetical protein